MIRRLKFNDVPAFIIFLQIFTQNLALLDQKYSPLIKLSIIAIDFPIAIAENDEKRGSDL